MLELLDIKLSGGVAEMCGESEHWVYTGDRYKPEGTYAFGWLGVHVSLVPVGVLVMTGVGKDVVASTVILSVSEIQ